MLKCLLPLLAAVAAFAQSDLPVTLTQGPPPEGYQAVYGYTGTNQIWACYAPSIQTTGKRADIPYAISATSNANPAALTVTAHGFDANSRPMVTVSGATGDYVSLNGTFTATVVDTNTLSVPINSTAFVAGHGPTSLTSTAPSKNQASWAVVRYFYDGSNNLILRVWLAGSVGLQAKCSDATSTTNNIQ